MDQTVDTMTSAIDPGGLSADAYISVLQKDYFRPLPSEEKLTSSNILDDFIWPLFINNYQQLAMAQTTGRPWYLMNLFSSSTTLTFVKSLNGRIKDSFYKYIENARPEDNEIILPFTIHCHSKALHVGNTSVITASQVKDHTGEELISYDVTHVVVGKKTRRPEQVSSVLPYEPDQLPRLSVVPSSDVINPDSDVTPTSYQVKKSDIDRNNHTNVSVYLRLFMDAAGRKGTENVEKFADKEVRLYGFNVLFVNESVLDDKLDVYVWADQTHHGVIYSQIKKGDRLLCYCKLDFKLIPNNSSKTVNAKL